MKNRNIILKTSIFIIASLMLFCTSDDKIFTMDDTKKFDSQMTGMVIDKNGNGIVGVTVTTIPDGKVTFTNPGGTFTLSDLNAGTHRLSFSRYEYIDTVLSDSFIVNLNSTKNIGTPFRMTYRYGKIVGAVKDSAGNPFAEQAGIQVEGQDVGSMTYSEGGFTLNRVLPGNVKVYSVIPGIGYGTADIETFADSVISGVEVRIDKVGGTVVGTLKDKEENPISNAELTAVGGILKTQTDSLGDFIFTNVPSDLDIQISVSIGDTISTKIIGIKVEEGGLFDIGNITVITDIMQDSLINIPDLLFYTNASVETLSIVVTPKSLDSTLVIKEFYWFLGSDTNVHSITNIGEFDLLIDSTGIDTVKVQCMTIDSIFSNVATFIVIVNELNNIKVTYDGNGNTGGTVPVDTNGYTRGTGIVLQGNDSGLVKAGATFAGWNTEALGTGDTCPTGSLFIIDSTDVTLYAQWSIDSTYSVTYNGNGSVGGTVPVDSVNYLAGSSVMVSGNIGTLVKPDSLFVGWNTLANGTGDTLLPDSLYIIDTLDVTFYAQWIPQTHNVIYDGNGNSGGTVPVDTVNYLAGSVVTVNGNSGTLVKTGLTFAGWNTLSDGSGVSYKDSDTYSIDTLNDTLYANWKCRITPKKDTLWKFSSNATLVNTGDSIVSIGSSVSIHYLPDAGYELISISDTTGTNASYSGDTLTCTVTSNFSPVFATLPISDTFGPYLVHATCGVLDTMTSHPVVNDTVDAYINTAANGTGQYWIDCPGDLSGMKRIEVTYSTTGTETLAFGLVPGQLNFSALLSWGKTPRVYIKDLPGTSGALRTDTVLVNDLSPTPWGDPSTPALDIATTGLMYVSVYGNGAATFKIANIDIINKDTIPAAANIVDYPDVWRLGLDSTGSTIDLDTTDTCLTISATSNGEVGGLLPDMSINFNIDDKRNKIETADAKYINIAYESNASVKLDVSSASDQWGEYTATLFASSGRNEISIHVDSLRSEFMVIEGALLNSFDNAVALSMRFITCKQTGVPFNPSMKIYDFSMTSTAQYSVISDINDIDFVKYLTFTADYDGGDSAYVDNSVSFPDSLPFMFNSQGGNSSVSVEYIGAWHNDQPKQLSITYKSDNSFLLNVYISDVVGLPFTKSIAASGTQTTIDIPFSSLDVPPTETFDLTKVQLIRFTPEQLGITNAVFYDVKVTYQPM